MLTTRFDAAAVPIATHSIAELQDPPDPSLLAHLCARGAGLIKQLSETDCVLNRNWGYDAEGIWVTGGCGAEFAVAQ